MKIVPTLALVLLLVPTLGMAQAVPTPPSAGVHVSAPVVNIGTDGDGDRVTFGHDAHVKAYETVENLVTMGGDALIEGTVTGDVVTLGGNVRVTAAGDVQGDLVTFGGNTQVHDTALVTGTQTTVGGHGGDANHASLIGFLWAPASGLLAFALLFLLGFVLQRVTPERLAAMQAVVIRNPVRSLGLGFIGFVGALAAMGLLLVTVVGIPASIALFFGTPIALYVGLAVSATVLGAALPIERFKGRPVHQLAAGVGVIFLGSVIPVLGWGIVVVSTLVGFGALIQTRFRQTPPPESITAGGPYRAQTA